MALKLITENNAGCPIEYHRIHGISYTKNHLSISLAVYKDKDAKDNGKPPVEIQNYKMPKVGYNSSASDRPQVYTYLKSLPEFNGAEDC